MKWYWYGIGFIVLVVVAVLLGHMQIGEGKVTDTVANVETQGIIWKTTEAYLTNDHDSFYCIQDPQIKQQADAFANSKALVTVHYRSYFYLFPWECGHGGEKYGNAGVVYQIEAK